MVESVFVFNILIVSILLLIVFKSCEANKLHYETIKYSSFEGVLYLTSPFCWILAMVPANKHVITIKYSILKNKYALDVLLAYLYRM